MFKGQAKTDYQRQYMRDRRAKQAAAKLKPKPWKPTQAIVSKIEHWIRQKRRRPWKLGELGREVLEGLDLTEEWTTEEWMEACHRLKAITAMRQQEREQERQRSQAKANVPTCSFCGELGSGSRMLVGAAGDSLRICEACVREAAEVIAKRQMATQPS
jgi:hypothetical protein